MLFSPLLYWWNNDIKITQHIYFQKDYTCQHFSYRKLGEKNKRCPAKLSVIIKADPRREGKMGRWVLLVWLIWIKLLHYDTVLLLRFLYLSAACLRCRAKVDLHLPQFPTVVILENIHNHNVHSVEALKYRDVGEEAQEELIRLFEMGHSAAAGLSAFRNDLHYKMGDNYVHASADRALCLFKYTLLKLFRFYKASSIYMIQCTMYMIQYKNKWYFYEPIVQICTTPKSMLF